jgi:hypothetical protein
LLTKKQYLQIITIEFKLEQFNLFSNDLVKCLICYQPYVHQVPEDSVEMTLAHSNVLLLREFDLENLTFLVEDRFSDRMCSLVNLEENNLERMSAKDILRRNSKNILDFFLVDRETIETEIKTLLEENQMTQAVFDKFFDCLEFPSRHFTTEEIVINDVSMLSSVVRFNGACFVFVSCRFDQVNILQWKLLNYVKRRRLCDTLTE